MPFRSFRNVTPPGRRSIFAERVFIVIFIAILIGWILIALWSRVLDNFTYGYLGLNPDSTWDTILIAIVFTILLVIFIWVADQYELVPGGV